ncbi:hypothetical protein DFQ27_009377, partial [Actinomortierella ambigua]
MASLTVGTLLGAGRYGKVYKGRWHERGIALKKFPITNEEVRQAEAVRREIETLQCLVDRHLIQYYGATYHEDMLALVMDQVEGGSLQWVIETQPQQGHQRMDWSTKMRIAREIAHGLAYLHRHQILHLDLKSSNVLLKRHHHHLQVKLCDFWLPTVKARSVSNTVDRPVLHSASPRWMAPELFTASPKYSAKSDMYALGMVMWEMAANCTVPFQDQLDNVVIMAIVKRGEREVLPDNTPADYRQWVDRCWIHDPEKRPETSEMLPVAPTAADPLGMVITKSTVVKTKPTPTSPATSVSESTSSPTPTSESTPSLSPASPTSPASTTVTDDLLLLLARGHEGDVEAQLILGATYEQGLSNVDQNDTVAFQWFLRAATYDSTEAQYKTGHCFIVGCGTPKNLGAGLYWLRRAAEKGHARAQNDLGWMYHRGLGTANNGRDDAQAMVWFRKAAAQGNPEAQFNVGWMYQNAYGVSQDDGEAWVWYHKAADLGNASARANIGALYLRGLGSVGRDYGEALAWCRLAAGQEDASAMNNIGWMYQNGLGVGRNYQEAISWYCRAANQGNADAQLNLGVMYEEGLGVVKDVQQAAV